MVLKQYSTRGFNQRARRFQVKDALWVFVLLLIFLWVFHQMKQRVYLYNSNGSDKLDEAEEIMLRIGRKDLKPSFNLEMATAVGNQEVDLAEETSKDTVVTDDEEIDMEDREKSDEIEHDQLQDLIEEDDRIR